MSRPSVARPVWSALSRVWDHLLGRPAGFTSPPASLPVRLNLLPLEDRVVPDGRPLPLPMIFSGVGPGSAPRVKAYFAETGTLAFERTPFDPAFTGGVRVGTGDVNGDTWPDLIAAAGPGGGPHVTVLDSKTGQPIAGPLGNFFAYDVQFTGGVSVASGDVDGDGRADVITAAGAGGGPHVKVYSGRTGEVIGQFFAFAPEFTGGVSVGAADFTGDGKADLLVGAGAGGSPHVRVFDLNAAGGPADVRNFFAFDVGFPGGANVSTDWKAGDVTGDGVPDIVVGRGAGAGSLVRVFDGVTTQLHAEFSPFGTAMTAGVVTAAAFVTDDQYADVVVGTAAGPTASIRVFDGRTLAELPQPQSRYVPFGAGFTNGLAVAASNDPPVDPTYLQFGGYSQNPVPASSPFTIAADVFDANNSTNGQQTPTGTVTFTRVGVGPLGTAAVAPNGPGQGRAVLTVPAYTLPPGQYGSQGYGPNWLTLTYSGDDWFHGSSTYAPPLTVSPPALPLVWAMPTRHAKEKGANAGMVTLHRTITNPAADTGLTVQFEVGGTATPIVDHTLAAGTHSVSFQPGERTAGVLITPTVDTVADRGEYVRVRLNDAAGYTVDATRRAADTGIEDDQATDRVAPTCGECAAGSPLDPLGGADTGGSEKLSSGVRTDGRVRVNLADAGGERPGAVPAAVLQWTNADGYSDLFGGPGTRLADVPRLLPDEAGGFVLADGGYSATPFVPAGGGFAPRFGGPATLAADGPDRYRVTDGAGGVLVFASYGVEVPFYIRGQLVERTDAAGRTATFDYTPDESEWGRMGVPKAVEWSDPASGVTETVTYTTALLVDPAGDRHPRVTAIHRTRGTGEVETVALQYAFRPVTAPPAVGLQYVAVLNGTTRTRHPDAVTAVMAGETYTRFYQSGQAGGYEDGLKFHLGERATARLRAAFPFAGDLGTLSDAQVAPYADLKLEYDAQRRVSKIVRAGEGCSACAGGLGGAVLSYTASGFAPGVNTWAVKAAEALDDGTVNAVYANAWGQPLLATTTEAGTGRTWASYTKYDAAHRPVMVAAPSAVSGYSDALPDLVGFSGGNAAHLRDAAGLVSTFAYPATTTATDTVAGGVVWLASSGWVQNGEFGGGVKQWERAYYARTAGGFSTYHPAADTRYRNADGSGGQTTTYAYTWQTGTHHAHTLTTTLPAVTAGLNGPGVAVTMTSVVDADGRVVWAKDAAGFLTHYQYDPLTGALLKAVSDVNTALPYEYTALPSGWSTPAGGGSHQTYRFEADGLGRTTKATDPLGRVTYTVYNDAAREVRVYRGWTGSQPTGPTQVYREDWGRGYAEWLSMDTFAATMGGRPTGGEAIENVQSLTRAHVNPAGQTVAADAYSDLGWSGYSQEPAIGTAGVNYLRTEYGYDKRGRANKAVGPDGVIGRTVYDAIGRPVSSWAGTNDTPASGFWSPSNPAGMVKLADAEYDHGGVGDSNLTAYTLHPGHGRADRRTELAYDWRNRLEAVKEGVEAVEGESVNRPLARYTYDNLGQVLTAAVYDGDTVAVGTAPTDARRRAVSAFSYDEYGRAYRTDSYAANQTTGALAAVPLTEQVWYDLRGLAVKTQSADGRVSKWQYDGLGRVTADFLTDGGGDATWDEAHTLTGDTVWAQTEYAYDAASQLVQTTGRARAFGQAGTGPLGTPTAGVQARVSYAGYYYDAAGRPTDAVDVGTNGGVPWTRPASAPARSDTVLVSSVGYDGGGRPQDATDPRGLTARTAYDLLGRVTSSTAAFGTADAFTVSFDYDTAGRLLDVTAPGGRTTAYGYDAWGRAASVTERYATSLARTSTVALDDLGGALTATDPVGTVTAFTENVLGRAVSVTAATGTPLARTASGTFDVFGRPLTATDPRGFVTLYGYDDIARTATVTDAAGFAWTTAFDKAGRVTSATNPFGHTSTVGYDFPGRVVSVTDPLNHTTTIQRTVNATEDRTTDPLGHTRTQTFDRFGRTASVADALNNVTTFGYDRNSNTTSVTNAKGVTTAFAFDALDRMTGVTEAVGLPEQRTTAYTFTAAGDLGGVTDPLGRQTTFGYDAAGRRTGQTAAAGTADAFTVGVAYDTLDRVVSITNPGSRTTAYAYDALGQLTKATEGVGTALARDTTFGYDAGGNRTSVTDPLGFTTLTAYDKLGRVSGVTDATGGLVQVAYDKAGRTSSVTDPVGNVTSWGYDAAGRRTSETDPRGKTTAYAYDAADRLVSITDRIGRVREFGYDAADRMTSETWKTGGATVQTQAFGYDAVGNQTSATDPDGSYALTYDSLNRVVGVSGPWGVTQAFGYDAADNRTSTSDNKGGGSSSTFDGLNRLKSRTQTATGMGTVRADWGYTAAGDVGTVSRYSDASGTTLAGSTTNSYDALGRLVGIDHKNAAGTSVGTYAYTFDAGDRLTGETFNGTGKTYAYDKLGQLTSDNGSAVSYDAAGNRSMTGYVTGTGNRTTADGTWTYTYDDAGQLTGKSKSGEAWAYTYDHTGRMTGASKSATPGGTVTDAVSYKLDAWGNRIERGQSGTASSTARYVVDGWDTAKPAALGTEGFEAVMDLDGSNAVTSRRVFGSGFDEAVARQDANGSVTWYGADAQGTVRQVFDNTGNSVGSRAFTGFGAVTATGGTGLDRYAYTGTVTDPLTGLVGDDARQYDPTLGKWTSDDPIGFGGGDYNVSRTVGNAVTTGTDPSGLAKPSDEWYHWVTPLVGLKAVQRGTSQASFAAAGWARTSIGGTFGNALGETLDVVGELHVHGENLVDSVNLNPVNYYYQMQGQINRYHGAYQLTQKRGYNPAVGYLMVNGLFAADITGTYGIVAGIDGHDPLTGASMSNSERGASFIIGAHTLGMLLAGPFMGGGGAKPGPVPRTVAGAADLPIAKPVLPLARRAPPLEPIIIDPEPCPAAPGGKPAVPEGPPAAPKTATGPKTGGKYADEVVGMNKGMKAEDVTKGVKYFTPAETEAFRVTVDAEGRLVYAQSGKRVTTQRGIFVMDEHGNVYVHPDPKDGVIHHSSLSSGGKVAGAGDLSATDGVITKLNDSTGHYFKTQMKKGGALNRVADELTQQGAKFDRGVVQPFYE